ncbi:MAG: Lrp/AsnC family transcriptional regulator [Clostridia bacterium]|nr:Lrp/AsnC family transcriptional regulator [Clostridia bacterium]
MEQKILKLLEKDARMSNSDIADILGTTPEAVEAAVRKMEKDGIIRGYKTVIDWEKVAADRVNAIIELKIAPKTGCGFEEVAERIAKYPEVESVSLMSGAYDLNVVVSGKTFREVANFVAKELSTMDSVTSTATQFVMRRYKEFDVCLTESESDGRGLYSL